MQSKAVHKYQCHAAVRDICVLRISTHSRPLCSPPVRSVDSLVTTAINIYDVEAAGATKTERTGIIKLKSEIKQVRASSADCFPKGL